MKRILVIEDDDLEVTIKICGILQAAGYTVDLASGADEALQKAGSRRPDLVLADVSAPALKLRSLLQHAKIVGTCNQGTADEMGLVGEGLGFSNVLLKAFTQEELLATVREALDF